MTFSHGKNTYFAIDDSGGTLRDISSYCNSVDFPETVETAETTGFGANSKTYVVGLKDTTISIEGNWDPTLDGYLAGILGAAAGSFEYAPQGNSSSNILFSGECICTNYSVNSGVGDSVKFSATFQVTGDVTRGTIV